MLQNIKSLYYFNKKLFSLIEEGKKLELIKYNKNLQKNLNINLTNYRYFSGRYIIYESKGRGKEYNWYDDTLRYEGEYLNVKKRGKGKEYNYDDNLIYEGEYLNGKRNGKTLIYDENGKLRTEIDYKNGIIWNMIQYDANGNILKEFHNGKGIRKEYEDGICSYEGEFLNGLKNGKGKE